MAALPPSAAEGIAAGTRRPERHSDRRAHLGAGRGERLVPPVADVRLARLLDEPAQGEEIRRALAPSPPAAGARLVLKGEWRYLEHDWVATEGGYVYEAP